MSHSTFYSQLRPATARQRIYMQERGIDFPERITVGQASQLIADYQERHDIEDEHHPMDQGDHGDH